MAVNPDKNIVEQSLIARLIGKIKRIALDMGDSVTAETTRATAAEAAAKTEVVQGENCTVEKTAAADGHDVYTINADGKPQVQADWAQNDSSQVDYIKNRPQNLVQDADYVHTDNNYTDAEKTKLGGIESGAQVNVIEKVKVNGTEQGVTDKAVDISVPTASTATPLKDGTASAGSSSQWARGDHVHPTDDSREAVSNKKQVVNDSSTTEYPSSKAVADFVNSSVATNTANFLGTIAESSLGLDYTATNEQIALALNVHSWVSTPTNNDYCFVSVNDPQTTDVDEYRRFKFNGSVWAYEYTLNNSSFTQPQWDAINSGLTSSDRTAYNAAVTLLNSHVENGGIHVTSSEKNAWNGKYTKPSTGIPKTDLASDVQTSLGKADTALQDHQSVTDNNPTLAWGATSTVGTVGSTNLRVTMPSNPASGKADNTPTFTEASTRANLNGSGETMPTILGKIKKWFTDLGSLAFKDTLSSFNYESIGSTAVDLNDKLYANECHAYAWTYANRNNVANRPTNDGGVVLSFAFYTTTYGVQIAMDGNDYEKPLYIRFKAANQWKAWIPFRDASWINSGTFNTDRIADDAITAAKVKDNETLPVHISGRSQYVRPFVINKGAQTTNVWAKVATASVSAWNGYAITFAAGYDGYASASSYAGEITVGYQVGNGGAYATHQFYVYRRRYTSTSTLDARLIRKGDVLELWVKDGITDTNLYLTPVYFKGFSVNYADTDDRTKQLTDSAFTTYIADKTSYEPLIRTIVFNAGIAQKGSPTTPVYVDLDGQVKECTPSSMSVGSATNATNVNLSSTPDATIGDTIKAGNGISVLVNNAGNAYRWGGYRLSVGAFSIQDDTICIV